VRRPEQRRHGHGSTEAADAGSAGAVPSSGGVAVNPGGSGSPGGTGKHVHQRYLLRVRTFMKRILVPISAALLLAACGGSAPSPGSSAPPSATSLAQKIPGCSGAAADTPSVLETGEATCTLPDGSLITVGTFSSSASETQWIQDGGSPSSPDSLYVGCCIQGSGWAATVGFSDDTQSPIGANYQTVISAIGGRHVTG
jgi:hypothetical protein